MTVEEYAAACGEMKDKFEDDSSYPDSFSFTSTSVDYIEHVVSESKRLNPPEELQEFHETRIRYGEATIKFLKDTGLLQLIQDLEKAVEEEDRVKLLRLEAQMEDVEDKMSEFDDEISELEDEAERVQDALSPATFRILRGGGCL